jgi:hypothetical protein
VRTDGHGHVRDADTYSRLKDRALKGMVHVHD